MNKNNYYVDINYSGQHDLHLMLDNEREEDSVLYYLDLKKGTENSNATFYPKIFKDDAVVITSWGSYERDVILELMPIVDLGDDKELITKIEEIILEKRIKLFSE